MAVPLWLPGIELGLRLWTGRYEDHDNTWLRWTDAAGTPIATGAERAKHEHHATSVWPTNFGVSECRRSNEPGPQPTTLFSKLRLLWGKMHLSP